MSVKRIVEKLLTEKNFTPSKLLPGHQVDYYSKNEDEMVIIKNTGYGNFTIGNKTVSASQIDDEWRKTCNIGYSDVAEGPGDPNETKNTDKEEDYYQQFDYPEIRGGNS